MTCQMGTCPETGRRRFGTRILCDQHHDWVQKVRARISLIGFGEHTSPAPEWPHGWANLTCHLCGAGWTGPVGETCGWCEDRLQAQRQGQATLVLLEPDIELEASAEDINRARRAWTKRLAVAVEAGIVTTAEAAEAVNTWLARMADQEEAA